MSKDSKNRKETEELFLESQEIIQSVINNLEENLSSNVSELQGQLKELIESQLKLGLELFNKYLIQPEFLWYYVSPDTRVKIFTGEKNATGHRKSWGECFEGSLGGRKCPSCKKAGIEHRIIEVPHGFTTKKSCWGPGVPSYRVQCTGCSSWNGGWVRVERCYK